MNKSSELTVQERTACGQGDSDARQTKPEW